MPLDSSPAEPTSTAPVKTSVLTAYCSLSLPLAAVGLPMAVYIPPFYAEQMGSNLAVIGLVFTLARVWDFITDPTIGVLIDRYPSRWGRRRHWFVLAMPFAMLGGYQVYMPGENINETMLIFWLFIMYIGVTMANVTQQSWGVDLSSAYDQRSRIYGWREISMSLGMLLVLVLPAIAEQLFEADSREKVALMGWFLIFTMPLTCFWALKTVPDKTGPQVAPVKMNWSELKTIVSENPAFTRCLIAVFLTFFGATATAAVYLFVLNWVFNLDAISSTLLLVMFVAVTLGSPIWMRLSYRFGKPTALIIGLIYPSIILFGYLLVDRENATASIAILSAVLGIGSSAPPIILRAILADTIDLDALQNKGKYRSGIMFACFTTSEKLASAIGIGVVYWLLAQIGFDPAASENSAEALDWLIYIFVLIPVAANCAALLVIRNFPITAKEHAQTIEQLQRLH